VGRLPGASRRPPRTPYNPGQQRPHPRRRRAPGRRRPAGRGRERGDPAGGRVADAGQGPGRAPGWPDAAAGHVPHDLQPPQRPAVVLVRITHAPGHHPWPARLLLPGVPPDDHRLRDVRVPTSTEVLDLEAEIVARLEAPRPGSGTPRQIQTTRSARVEVPVARHERSAAHVGHSRDPDVVVGHDYAGAPTCGSTRWSSSGYVQVQSTASGDGHRAPANDRGRPASQVRQRVVVAKPRSRLLGNDLRSAPVV
jgi:hypothetical protein